MAEQFGKTWWGQRWLGILGAIDSNKSSQRGIGYTRGKHVKDLLVAGNMITAKVKGSRSKPYSLRITAVPFQRTQIDSLMTKIIERPALVAKLLNGEVDSSIVTIAEELNMTVFPRRWTDLQMQCSCPEKTMPCKHIVAIIYMASRNIDNNPFIIFNLHNLYLQTELRQRGITLPDRIGEDIPVFSRTLKTRNYAYNVSDDAVYERIDFSQLQNISRALLLLLPDRPPFYPSGNFRDKYALQISHITKEITRVLSKPKGVAGVFPYNSKQHLTRRSTVSVRVDVFNDAKASGSSHKIRRVEQLLAALFTLPPGRLADYHRSVAAMRKVALAALHLTANGMIIPQIIRTDHSDYLIRWLPAMIDHRVKAIVDRLLISLPCDLLMLIVQDRRKKEVRLIDNLALELLSIFIGKIVTRLSKTDKKDVFENLFFKHKAHPFKTISESALPLGIKTWLDRYNMPAGKHIIVITVSELPTGDFAADISVEDNAAADPATHVPLHDILTKKKYEARRYDIIREVSRLSSFVRGLDAYVDAGGKKPIRFSNVEFAPFLTDILPAVRLLGVRVMLPKSLQKLLHPKVSVRLNKADKGKSFINMANLLSFNWQVALGETIVSPEEFDKMLKTASRLFKFKENYIYVSDLDIERIRKAITAGKPLSPSQMLHTALANEYEGAPVLLSNEVYNLIGELNSTENIALPHNLNAQMRPYQLRGFSWMYRNSRIGFGSIIADDMGLGKTLQVIAVLLKYKEEGLINNKHKALVIVPTGLLANWQAEIEKFAPALSIYIFHGQSRDLALLDPADVMLTTYGVVRSDSETLKKRKWQVMVIDEAQNIKNYDTAQAKAVKSIPAGIRIAMSGTPVENRLTEFWSIMDYTNKGYLGTVKAFKDDYANPIQLYNDARITDRFRKVTAPFMMRRMKTDKNIISDLPDKIELNQYARLTTQQAALYEKSMQAAMQQIENVNETDKQSIFKRDGLVLQMILSLKQICNHPTQFLKNDQFDPHLSGKTELLLEILDSIVENGEKTLLFTQFTEMGQLLERFIGERFGESPMFYHGGCSVKQRSEMVERFQTNRADNIFILSLKAAGTGLNLTAASHVIHYDLWWNPAVENQATDRAYRIGQEKNVMVHRLICKDTFEERIDAMIGQKKLLADMTVASGESWLGKLSNKELRELFG
ncbi:MAG: DEAD/DEAH box helicase [Tannerellaceae bacterium]|jgi:ERCC4-related helicase|nr:DEAD/DEAH box helicase [Tannerellaceae bacterium]